jgi:hypothetical protein
VQDAKAKVGETLQPRERGSVADYLRTWLANVIEPGKAGTTAALYHAILEKHVLEHGRAQPASIVSAPMMSTIISSSALLAFSGPWLAVRADAERAARRQVPWQRGAVGPAT